MEDKNRTQELAQAKSKFLADMSREIQNAMKDILSYSDFIKQTNLDAKQTEYFDVIYKNAHKIAWISNDILDFSQLELGKIELQSIDFNLEYLINDIFQQAGKLKKVQAVDTYVDIGKDVPRNLIGDPTRLRQVLLNLVSNAFKFTQKGKVGVIVKTAEGKDDGTNENVKLKITVKDSGKGIPKNQQESIFNLQSHEELAKSWEFGGTGLGLAICKLMIEAMEGSVGIASEEGKGSEFTAELSFKKGTSLRDRKIYPLTREELVGKKAVIVDDNEIARKILKKCCDTMGIEAVVISASPKETLQKLENISDDGEVPDLILCDIMMPEMDGYEMIQRIQANDKLKRIKSIAVTSAVHVGSAKNAQESGFNGFLPKPVFLDELAQVITTVLGDKRDKKTIVTRHMAEELKFRGTKVLIIEAKGTEHKLLEESLDMMECEREYVANGQEAVECLKENIYDLCLLDFRVFNDEGAEIVKVMKEVSRNMPTVALLTKGMESRRSECLDAGIDDFLVRPVDMTSLKRIIKRYGKS